NLDTKINAIDSRTVQDYTTKFQNYNSEFKSRIDELEQRSREQLETIKQTQQDIKNILARYQNDMVVLVETNGRLLTDQLLLSNSNKELSDYLKNQEILYRKIIMVLYLEIKKLKGEMNEALNENNILEYVNQNIIGM